MNPTTFLYRSRRHASVRAWMIAVSCLGLSLEAPVTHAAAFDPGSEAADEPATETAPAAFDEPVPEAEVEKPDESAAPKRRRFYSSVGVGVDFSRGEYGSEEATNTVATPAYLKLEWEPVAFKFTIPFLLINGSEGVVGTTDGPTSQGGNVLGESYRYGLGDLTTSLTYTYYPTRQQKWWPLVDLRVKVKIPTADADLGTQKTDTTLQFELTERFGPVAVFGGFGYRFKGGGAYDDILLASVGLNYRATKKVSAGLAFDWREASVSGVPDSKELSPSLMFKLDEHARFGPYGVVGFSDASPDWGIGAMSSWNF